MAQLSAVITTSDSEFRSTITTLLRSSGVSIGIIDERHAGNTWPDIAQDAQAWANEVKRSTAAEPIVVEPGGSFTL